MEMSDGEFWDWWSGRFVSNQDRFITPMDSSVDKQVSKVQSVGKSDMELINDTWDHVRRLTIYKLSKEWKTPAETISEGVGDCEDFSFLVTSMLSALGMKSKLQVGWLERNNGRRGEHVWAESNGRVIDATGTQESIEGMKYTPTRTFVIEPLVLE